MSEQHNNNCEGIELTLGLSLNGKFGVDPIITQTKKIKRTCSTISTSTTSLRSFELARTCSMPVYEEEESSRKRKELQSFRHPKLLLEKESIVGSHDGNNGIVSQRSSGSSGLSDLETLITPSHGMNKMTEAKSPQSVESFSLHNEPVNREVKPTRSISAPNEMVKNALSDMPCVSTKGNGPNGKRVDGFLYRYKKGDEVRIVCVCHGSFLTPAEFIKHAGGGDVEHPLRHIVVHPSPSL